MTPRHRPGANSDWSAKRHATDKGLPPPFSYRRVGETLMATLDDRGRILVARTAAAEVEPNYAAALGRDISDLGVWVPASNRGCDVRTHR